VVPFVLVIDEKYDGVTNHQVVVALWGRLGVFGLLGVLAQVLCHTSTFLQWMLSDEIDFTLRYSTEENLNFNKIGNLTLAKM
jgi:hypothetical protein